jgi:carbonic anhydrase
MQLRAAISLTKNLPNYFKRAPFSAINLLTKPTSLLSPAKIMGQRMFCHHAVEAVRPDFIPSLEKRKQQVLWLGCSDSGYEETTILDLLPEEMIVVRNIGNMALSTDLAWASAVQYALESLEAWLLSNE